MITTNVLRWVVTYTANLLENLQVIVHSLEIIVHAFVSNQ